MNKKMKKLGFQCNAFYSLGYQLFRFMFGVSWHRSFSNTIISLYLGVIYIQLCWFWKEEIDEKSAQKQSIDNK